MELFSLRDVQLTMSAGLFILGMATFTVGVFVLVARSMSKEMRTLSNQTAKIAQKGLAEDISGLVGNSAALLSTMTQLVKTAAGVGIFLTSMGLALIGGAYWLVLQINWI